MNNLLNISVLTTATATEYNRSIPSLIFATHDFKLTAEYCTRLISQLKTLIESSHLEIEHEADNYYHFLEHVIPWRTLQEVSFYLCLDFLKIICLQHLKKRSSIRPPPPPPQVA